MTEENTFAQAVQMLRDARKAIMDAARLVDGDLPELFHEAEFTLSPALFGQLLMSHLPNMGRMTQADKLFWLEVENAIGPDHVGELRRVGGFMNKLGEF